MLAVTHLLNRMRTKATHNRVKWILTNLRDVLLNLMVRYLQSMLSNTVSSLKSFYSKHPILVLTQEFCWVGACIGSGVAFETIKLSG